MSFYHIFGWCTFCFFFYWKKCISRAQNSICHCSWNFGCSKLPTCVIPGNGARLSSRTSAPWNGSVTKSDLKQNKNKKFLHQQGLTTIKTVFIYTERFKTHNSSCKTPLFALTAQGLLLITWSAVACRSSLGHSHRSRHIGSPPRCSPCRRWLPELSTRLRPTPVLHRSLRLQTKSN